MTTASDDDAATRRGRRVAPSRSTAARSTRRSTRRTRHVTGGTRQETHGAKSHERGRLTSTRDANSATVAIAAPPAFEPAGHAAIARPAICTTAIAGIATKFSASPATVTRVKIDAGTASARARRRARPRRASLHGTQPRRRRRRRRGATRRRHNAPASRRTTARRPTSMTSPADRRSPRRRRPVRYCQGGGGEARETDDEIHARRQHGTPHGRVVRHDRAVAEHRRQRAERGDPSRSAGQCAAPRSTVPSAARRCRRRSRSRDTSPPPAGAASTSRQPGAIADENGRDDRGGSGACRRDVPAVRRRARGAAAASR